MTDHDEAALFEGHRGRLCTRHVSVGYRAWCLDCGEWCSPAAPCIRCDPLVVEVVTREE